MTTRCLPVCAGIALIAMIFAACTHAGSPPEDVPIGTKAVTLRPGATFSVELIQKYDDGYTSRDTSHPKLLSKIATVGGRKDLLVWEGAPGSINYWDIDAKGDLWEFSSFNGSEKSLESGIWVGFPTSGEGCYSTLTMDTTMNMGGGDTKRFLHKQISTPAGEEYLTIMDKTYLAHKIHTYIQRYVWDNNRLSSESQEFTMTQWFVAELGAIVKASTYSQRYRPYQFSYRVFKIEE